MSDWKPIETAPNLESVLIACANGRLHVAWFHEAQGGWQTFFCNDPLDPRFPEECPTYWMPLPDPPSDLRMAIDELEQTIRTLPEG